MSRVDQRPAFPTTFFNDGERNVTAPDGQLVPPGGSVRMQGMTVRQLYAGLALQGYLASCGPHTEPAEVASTIAADCWKLADALIAAEHGGGQ